MVEKIYSRSLIKKGFYCSLYERVWWLMDNQDWKGVKKRQKKGCILKTVKSNKKRKILYRPVIHKKKLKN